MRCITSIDLGSNSFRVLKYNLTTNSSVADFETAVGTADGLAKTGNVSQDTLVRIITAIKQSIKIVNYNPKDAIAVTTQALRVAKNSKEILQAIEDKTDIKFTIIDGEQEAKLTLKAIQYALKREQLKDDNFVLLDIGGGSTELVISKNNQLNLKSFPYGIVTLSQSKDKQKDLKNLKQEVLNFLNNSNIDIENSYFISTAGTPTTVAALKHQLNYKTYDKKIVNGTKVTLKDLDILSEKLKKLSKEQLEIEVGSGRGDYITTGFDIFKLFFKTLKKRYSIVFDDGLREGVAIEAYEKSI